MGELLLLRVAGYVCWRPLFYHCDDVPWQKMIQDRRDICILALVLTSGSAKSYFEIFNVYATHNTARDIFSLH
jgi:hypothetical protein